MGVCVWVRLEREIPGGNQETDGKLLAKAMDILDGAARRLNVTPLSDFYSVSKKQALAEMADEDLTDEEYEALADDHVWWPAADGLASVVALQAWATDNASSLYRPELVLSDLASARAALEAAVREQVKFNLAVDA
jgi:hypothetical protein